MITLKTLFSLLASVSSIYSILITIRIILTWIPGMNNGFTRFLASISDPYLNLFRRIRWLRFGALDFSPVLALALLAVFSTAMTELSIAGTISVASLLSIIVRMILNVISSICTFVIILIAVRFLIHLVQPSAADGFFWNRFDQIFNPLIYKIGKIFSFGKFYTYRAAMITTIVVLILGNVLLQYAIVKIVKLIFLIPF